MIPSSQGAVIEGVETSYFPLTDPMLNTAMMLCALLQDLVLTRCSDKRAHQ